MFPCNSPLWSFTDHINQSIHLVRRPYGAIGCTLSFTAGPLKPIYSLGQKPIWRHWKHPASLQDHINQSIHLVRRPYGAIGSTLSFTAGPLKPIYSSCETPIWRHWEHPELHCRTILTNLFMVWDAHMAPLGASWASLQDHINQSIHWVRRPYGAIGSILSFTARPY